jgi:hypothetical protein
MNLKYRNPQTNDQFYWNHLIDQTKVWMRDILTTTWCGNIDHTKWNKFIQKIFKVDNK